MDFQNICNILTGYEKEKQERFAFICHKLKDFHIKKEQMKLRGFNDFNFIDLLKGYHDENTHSKIIAEFLDPQGSHYQGELFLEKFFEAIGMDYPKRDWSVHTEYFVENCTDKGQGRIDIFLDGGEKFVIIENKIGAGDQKSQIRKYVECIKKKKKIVDPNKILVLYLTLDGNKPSNWSLDGFCIVKDNLVNESGEVAKIKYISYQKEILEWVEKCIGEIENISNLREAFKQYQKAVEVVTNKEENIMNLKEYLLRDENREILADLIDNFEEFSKEIDDDKCREIVERENLKQILEEVKYSIREDVAKRIKDQLYNEGFEIVDGHRPFGNFLKMAYILFTKEDLTYGYILYFENQNIYNLQLGRINCKNIDKKDIQKIKEQCTKYDCWQIIKEDKCFSNIKHIDSFNSIGLYKNYLKGDNYYFNSLLAKIKSQLE